VTPRPPSKSAGRFRRRWPKWIKQARWAEMSCRWLPFCNEDWPDIPGMRVLHYQALLRPEEVADLLRISQRRV
jgi:hypothetical protein